MNTGETETIVKNLPVVNHNGDGLHPLVPTSELAIAKQVSNEQLIDEELKFQKVETAVEGKYLGLRGSIRLFQISRVISMLSLYLYLDQYDIHHKQHIKRAAARRDEALKLTRAAVYGAAPRA